MAFNWQTDGDFSFKDGYIGSNFGGNFALANDASEWTDLAGDTSETSLVGILHEIYSSVSSSTLAALTDTNISGLADGNILQYQTGDSKWHNIVPDYYTKTELDGGQLDNRYYTETELDGGQLDNRYYTETELDGAAGGAGAKIDKVAGAVAGNLAEMTAGGEVADSGIAAADVILRDGSVDFTSIVQYDSAKTFTNALDIVSKDYVDSVAQGLTIKEACRVATVAALPANTKTGSGVGAYLEADANGSINSVGIDGITDLAVGERILVKNEGGGASDADNGIYELTVVGDAGTPWKMTRTADFDGSPAGEVHDGCFTFIGEGSNLADTGWVLITSGTITVDTTPLEFAQFSGAGTYTAGTGLTLNGDTFHIGDGTVEARGGIDFQANDIAVSVDDVTLEISGTDVAIKAWDLQDAYDSGANGLLQLDAGIGAIVIYPSGSVASDNWTFADGDTTSDLDVTAIVEDFTVTGSGTIELTAPTVNVRSTASTINIGDNAVAQSINVGNTTSGTAVSIDAAGASYFTVDSANLTLSTTTSGNILVTAPTGVGTKIDMDADDVYVDVSSGGGIYLGSTPGTQNVQVGASSGGNSFTILGNAQSTIEVTGANLILGTATSGIIDIDSAGAIDIDAGGNVTIDTSNGSITLNNTDTALGHINFYTVGSGNINGYLAGTGAVNFQTVDGQIQLSANGSGNNLVLTSGSGIVDVNAGSHFDVTAQGQFDIKGASDSILGVLRTDNTNPVILDIYAQNSGSADATLNAYTIPLTGTTGYVKIGGNAVTGADFSYSIGEHTAQVSTLTIGATYTTSDTLVQAGSGGVKFYDAGNNGSSWAQGYVLLSDGTNAEWNTFETDFGEVSIFNALGQLYSAISGESLWDKDGSDNLTPQTAGDGLDIDAAGTASVTLDSVNNSWLKAAGANLDLAVSGAGAYVLTIESSGTGTNAIDVNATAGGIDVDAAGKIDVASSLADVAISFTASDGAGGLDFNAGSRGFDFDATGSFDVNISSGNFSFDSTAASNVTVAGANLTLSTTTSGVNGGNVLIDAVIGSSATGGAITMTADADSGWSVAGGNLAFATATSGNITASAVDNAVVTFDNASAGGKTFTIKEGAATLATFGSGDIAFNANGGSSDFYIGNISAGFQGVYAQIDVSHATDAATFGAQVDNASSGNSGISFYSTNTGSGDSDILLRASATTGSGNVTLRADNDFKIRYNEDATAADLFEVQRNATTIIQGTAAGGVSITPVSGQPFNVDVSGTADATVDTLNGDIQVTANRTSGASSSFFSVTGDTDTSSVDMAVKATNTGDNSTSALTLSANNTGAAGGGNPSSTVLISATSANGDATIHFVDNGNSGSTWAQGYVLLSDGSAAEWDNYETYFGEVSIFNALTQAYLSAGTTDLNEAYENFGAAAATVTVDLKDLKWDLNGAFSMEVALGNITSDDSDGFLISGFAGSGQNFNILANDTSNIIYLDATIEKMEMDVAAASYIKATGGSLTFQTLDDGTDGGDIDIDAAVGTGGSGGDVNIAADKSVNFDAKSSYFFGADAADSWVDSVAVSSGANAAAGDAQSSRTHLFHKTSDATQTTLKNGTGTTGLALTANKVYACKLVVIGKVDGVDTFSGWELDFVADDSNVFGKNRNNFAQQDGGTGDPSNWDVDVDVNAGNLRVRVTGENLAGIGISWSATLDATEVLD